MTKLFIPLLALLVGTLGVPPPEKKLRIDPDQNWRIVGGSNAPEGAYPYQISLRYQDVHNCGGSIIDNTTILTAGHCVSGFIPFLMSVVVGTNKLDSGGTGYIVSSVKVHENYSLFFKSNDIAIIKLSTPIVYSSTVGPIQLETSDVGGDVDAVLSGWGTTSFPGSSPNDLQQINLKTITNADCKSRHFFYPGVRETNICTLTPKGEGACHGDSGGPLVANGVQIGIVSWSIPCARGYPDVYARVSSYIDWINANK